MSEDFAHDLTTLMWLEVIAGGLMLSMPGFIRGFYVPWSWPRYLRELRLDLQLWYWNRLRVRVIQLRQPNRWL